MTPPTPQPDGAGRGFRGPQPTTLATQSCIAAFRRPHANASCDSLCGGACTLPLHDVRRKTLTPSVGTCFPQTIATVITAGVAPAVAEATDAQIAAALADLRARGERDRGAIPITILRFHSNMIEG